MDSRFSLQYIESEPTALPGRRSDATVPAKIWLHLVLSTKGRFPYLRQNSLRREMHAYLATVCRNFHCQEPTVGGVEEHVHVLCSLSKIMAPSDLIREIKSRSSHWVKSEGGLLRKFQWQNGYGAFSVSQSDIEPVRKYILDQVRHHQAVSFEDEFRQLLRLHQIDFDERFVWD